MNGPRMFATLAVCALLASFALAEETIHFREGGGVGYTDVLFDDTWIKTSLAAMTATTASRWTTTRFR